MHFSLRYTELVLHSLIPSSAGNERRCSWPLYVWHVLTLVFLWAVFCLQADLSGPTATAAADASATTINTNENADANANASANAKADANGDGSSRRRDSLAAAPAGKSTKQASLEAFFSPSARGEENANA